jgi:hypothetical protein
MAPARKPLSYFTDRFSDCPPSLISPPHHAKADHSVWVITGGNLQARLILSILWAWAGCVLVIIYLIFHILLINH